MLGKYISKYPKRMTNIIKNLHYLCNKCDQADAKILTVK